MVSTPPQPHSEQSFPVVGVGASAGGLEAFTELLSHLPIDTGMAFVLIQHLDPNQPSALSEIMARATPMPVSVAADGLAVAPNQVYVIPPNQVMTITAGALRLRTRHSNEVINRVVDIFFASLAQERGNQAIAIVLSGNGDDGTLGIEAIKAAGGITMAQTAASAQSGSMPHRAIATSQVDFVLAPAEMAQTLAEIGSHPYLNGANLSDIVVTDTAEQDTFTAILNLLRSKTRVDFSQYKPTTLQRRMARRMALHSLESLAEYQRYLQAQPTELEALHQEILINVTSFFRDTEAFEALKTEVFPALLRGRDRHDPIRIWVAGCSTGEEAYSIAICWLEYLADQTFNQPSQIFATDISEAAVETARRGIYRETQIDDVAPDRLQRFFVAVEQGYQVNSTVRELCIFARQNLTSDPPFSQLDLVSCRNVLIYFGSALQAKVLPMFHYGLKPDGFLMLGSSETVGDSSDLFSLVNRKHKLYAKQSLSLRLPLEFEQSSPTRPVLPSPMVRPARAAQDIDLEAATTAAILQRYQPTGVVVDAKLEIVQFKGQTGIYLEPEPGRASLNLLTMTKEPLRLDLRTVIYQAEQSGQPASRESVTLQAGDRQRVRLDVIPFNLDNTDTFYLVLFEAMAIETPVAALIPADDDWVAEPPEIRRYRQEIERLQQDLETTRSHLQSIIREREFANQDLRAANEEILSSNEELQSTNEELQTAKEEIQATNEELGTINDELYRRNAEATRITDDFQNLLNSINVPVLMLGSNLRIRRFTPAAAQLFNLIASDIGRPLGDINHRLAIADLEQQILAVIDTLTQTSQEIQGQNELWYELQIRPYRTLDNRIDGAVVVLIDIDRLKRNTEQLRAARDFAEGIVQTVREALVVLTHEFRVVTANEQFYQLFQVNPNETENRMIFELGNGQWNSPQLRSLLQEILPQQQRLTDFQVTHNFEHIGPKTMVLNACTLAQQHDDDLILIAIEELPPEP
ncbi:MAG: CheR family methyltransferase [Cyanobacteria bacterium P01_H01_bin.162]